MVMGKALNGKSDAVNPHVLFDEGEIASAVTPRRGILFHNTKVKGIVVVVAAMAASSTALFAKDAGGVKAQIASERKGNTNVFEEARAATVAKTWKSPNGEELPYRLHVPAEPQPGKLYPLVIHMHGAGSWGTNNVDQIKTGGGDFISWAKRHGEEYVFLAPQTPCRCKWVDSPWESKKSTMKEKPTASLRMAMEIIDDAIARYPVDRDRIYVMGISMGGYAAWELMQRRPELFAAGLPCCGGGDVALAPRLKDIAIWAFHGSKDNAVPVCRSRDMVAAIKAAGGEKIHYREYEGRGHNVWSPTFSDEKVFEWLFSQRRQQAARR